MWAPDLILLLPLCFPKHRICVFCDDDCETLCTGQNITYAGARIQYKAEEGANGRWEGHLASISVEDYLVAYGYQWKDPHKGKNVAHMIVGHPFYIIEITEPAILFGVSLEEI